MKTTLTVEIEYDPAMTDPEGLACAMDRLLETALSTPGIFDEYGNPKVGEFFVAKETARRAEGRLEHFRRRLAGRVRFGPCHCGSAVPIGTRKVPIRRITALSRFPMGAAAHNWRTWLNTRYCH